MSDSTPAGWYPDPENDAGQRYWDGSQWTEHRAPGAAPASPPPAPGGFSPVGQTPMPGQPPVYGQKVDTWLWQSIVATILCCLPFGIAGIVFASQANSAQTVGDFATAQAKAAQARTWTLVAVGAGLLVVVVYFFIGFAAAFGGGGF